jgi:hypothetical protein
MATLRVIVFWIDDICINQEDSTERRDHVNLMRKIYTEAIFFTVWLGPEDNDSHKALLILREFEKEGILSSIPFDSDKPIQTVPEGWVAIAALSLDAASCSA